MKNAFNGIGLSKIYLKPAISLASKVIDERNLYVLNCSVAIGQDHLLDVKG